MAAVGQAARNVSTEMAELKKLNATNMRVVNPPHAPTWDTP